MPKITPDSEPRDILLSLTKEEFVDWFLTRHPFRDHKLDAREALWFALQRRHDHLDARLTPLLDQMHQTVGGDLADWRKTQADINKIFREMDKISAETKLWLGL